MSLLLFLVLVGAIVSATTGFVWIALSLKKLSKGGVGSAQQGILNSSGEIAESVFSKEFREELKNRGRLHFENVINENAMFLQQDLRLTTSQLNDFMKDEIKKVLKEEFSGYEESISNAKDQAITSIQKTQQLIDEQRELLTQQLKDQAEKEKKELIAKFENNMGEIINHYVIEAIGTEIDLADQMEFIFTNLDENKQAILEDMQGGA